MKTIEELKSELKTNEKFIKDYTIKAQQIKEEIEARTRPLISKYVGKYLREFKKYDNNLDYSVYLYVKSGETNYYGGWQLTGFSFVTYFNEENNRTVFRTGENTINLDDIENGYYELEELTKEQFYDARNNALKKIMEEEYE